jgi:hypothetical protein
MIAQVYSSFAVHDRGIRVGRADLEVGDPLIAATFHAAILCSHFFNPVMTLGIVLGEFLVRCW